MLDLASKYGNQQEEKLEDNYNKETVNDEPQHTSGLDLASKYGGEQQIVTGGISKDVRNYNARFPERSKNFFGNAWSDTKDIVSGLGQMVGNTMNFAVGRPLMNLALAEKGTPIKDRLFTGEGIEDIKNLWNSLPALKEGLKENYGQSGIDIVNFDRIKEGKSPIKLDLPGLAQSYYAHPFNLLDLVGVGEVGKVGKLKNLSKGGEVSKFSKTVGNKILNPKYSENLIFNAGQRIAESKPVQNLINAIDNSPLRETTDIAADFLGLSPESRLMGTKGAEVRQAKLIEQANQTKNITERNKAIAENKANLSGLTDVEAKGLIKDIENPKGLNLEFKEYAHKPNEAIEKLLYEKMGFVPNAFHNKTLGDIDIIWGIGGEDGLGLSHIIDQRNNKNKINGTDFVRQLPDTIENGQVFQHPKDPNRRIIMDTKNKVSIALDYNGDSRKWVITAFQPTKGEIKKLKAANGNSASYVPGQNITGGKGSYSIPQPNAANTIISNNINNFNPPGRKPLYEYRDILREKAQQNADFYIEKGLLDEQTVKDLPVNTYASIKYNKPIDDLSDIEKLEALKDIEKMPKEQQPFYIPMMFDDKLRAGDFFANSTKKYKPNELKHRSVGMGLEENKTGGKRVYDPVELANRLDAHRIKMVNTENMINEIVDNFAKPYDMAKDKILDGYVPFNPDAFMKFYKKSIDLNDLTLRKLDELQNIDTALKSSVEDAIKTLPDDVIELMGAVKNNKIYQIPKDVAKTLMQGKNQKGVWEMMFDMGTAGFKRKVLGMSPKWFINNRIGNGIMAGLKGVMPQDYAKALNISDDLLPEALRTKSMYEAEKTIIGRTGGGNNSTFGNTMRLLGGEFIDTSELKGIKKAGVQLANTLGVPGKVINKITDSMFSFNQKFEDLERKAAYIHSANTVGKKLLKTTGQNIVKQDELLKATLENPDVLNAVMKDVDNTLGDYINMTSTERRQLRKIVPFYSWYRTITRYTLSLPESNPFRANIANKLSMILMSEEDETLPEYQRGAIETNYTAEKTGKPLMLNYEHSNPFSTFGDTVDNPTGLINPFLMQTLEATRGKREFMDKPFVTRNYENVFPDGYASLKEDSLGEYLNELPPIEKLKALPISYLRTSIPGLEWAERVGLGTVDNLLNNEEFRPYDALYDTSFGGYNYDEGFSKKPKGLNNTEQLLKVILPLQQQGQSVQKRVKTKRRAKN